METTPRGRLRAALPHLADFLRSSYLLKGMKLLRAVKPAVAMVAHVESLEALGQGHLAQVRYQVDGVVKSIDAEHLLLHHGVVPNTQLSRAMGAEHVWSERQDCREPVVDAGGATSVPQLGIAGDGTGIAGAITAEHRGRLAGLHAAWSLGRIDAATRDREAAAHRQALQRALRGRVFFETRYRAPQQ